MNDFVVINGEKNYILNGLLDLGWKGIKNLSDILEFEKLDHLKGLILRENDLEFIPDSISLLTSLELLNIAGNRLSYLPKSIGNMLSIETIIVEYNQLMKDFYGEEKANFVFIPVPLFHRGGYAALRETKEGQVVYCIGGPHKLENGFPVYESKIIRFIVFHEFGHTFTKPVVNEYEDQLNKYKHLFKYMKKSMKKLTYTDWITTCDEHFVRCGEYFLLRLAGFPEESQESYERDLKQGFLLLPFLKEKMEI